MAGDTPHTAGPYKVKDLRVVSGPSPFVGGCPGARFDDQTITGHELEPAITVNPANPRNIVAAWKQDVGTANQTRSDLVASSLDGGKTWSRRTIPGLTVCTGGTADTGSDPWVSAGRDGTVYFSGLAADLSTDPPTTAVVASHSRNGGRTWRRPATVTAPLQGNETDSVTGSPTRAGHAYLAWANFVVNPPRVNTLEFSRTTDGGATWAAPVLVDQPGPFQIDQAPRILVLPGGTLLAVFGRGDFETGLGSIHAARSLDEGRTWLPAVEVGSKPIPDVVDPETGLPLPSPGFPSAAVAPDGTVYVAFEDSRSATSGAVGVAWYDLRSNRPGDGALSADVWFAHSEDRGGSWQQGHVAGPTDLRTAPLPGHSFVGEHQGLAGLPRGRGFAAVFTLAAPQAKDGPTDIFFARIGPGRSASTGLRSGA